MMSLEASDELVREQVFWDVIELADIIEHSEDLNEARDRMRSLVETLEYLLICEG